MTSDVAVVILRNEYGDEEELHLPAKNCLSDAEVLLSRNVFCQVYSLLSTEENWSFSLASPSSNA